MITTQCLPDLPPRDETEILERDAQQIYDALTDAAWAKPVLDPSLIRPLTVLSCALLAGRGDSPARQREATRHIRGAMLNQAQLPVWLARRALLHPAQWVREWAARVVPDAPGGEPSRPPKL